MRYHVPLNNLFKTAAHHKGNLMRSLDFNTKDKSLLQNCKQHGVEFGGIE